jgi:hypothetical protein
MTELAIEAGWEVLSADLGLVQRHSIILLRNPQPSGLFDHSNLGGLEVTRRNPNYLNLLTFS